MRGEIALILLAAVFGVWGFYAAFAFRNGGMRRGARWYFDARQPNNVRHLPFLLLPTGLMGAGSAVVLALQELSDVWAEALVAASGLLIVASIVVAIVWILRPPRFLKPDWIRQREASASASHENDR